MSRHFCRSVLHRKVDDKAPYEQSPIRTVSLFGRFYLYIHTLDSAVGTEPSCPLGPANNELVNMPKLWHMPGAFNVRHIRTVGQKRGHVWVAATDVI